MGYKLADTAIADGWVLFKDKFPTDKDLQRGKFINVMYGDGSMGVEEVNLKTRVIVSLSKESIIAWKSPIPLQYVKEEAYTAIPYGIDGLHAVRRNSDGFIRAWDIPGEHYAKRIADEYNRAAQTTGYTGGPYERQV